MLRLDYKKYPARSLNTLGIDPAVVWRQQARYHTPNVIRLAYATQPRVVGHQGVELRVVAHCAATKVGGTERRVDLVREGFDCVIRTGAVIDTPQTPQTRPP